jgi:hypothetical protein
MRERTICRREMRRELMRVYREVVTDCPSGTTQMDVYQKVVEHPAPRFYVDPRRAHIVISPMMRGDHSKLEACGALKRQMYYDLYDTVMRLTQVKRFWHKSVYYILKEAVLEPAPRFYISKERMRMIWHEEVVETRQQKYKRIGKPYEKRDN